jgi:hypothetical protein
MGRQQTSTNIHEQKEAAIAASAEGGYSSPTTATRWAVVEADARSACATRSYSPLYPVSPPNHQTTAHHSTSMSLWPDFK